MRRFMLITLATAALAVAPTAAATAPTASTAPEPGPTPPKIAHAPMVELWDGGGGLPYLGSSTSYNAGDWENTLRAYHDNGTYLNQVAQVDNVADRQITRSARSSAHRAAVARAAHHRRHGHGNRHKKPAIVL